MVCGPVTCKNLSQFSSKHPRFSWETKEERDSFTYYFDFHEVIVHWYNSCYLFIGFFSFSVTRI